MHRWLGTSLAATLLLTACVTINVYFPAAEAKEAAKEFVENVIGDEASAPKPATPGGSASLHEPRSGMHKQPRREFNWLALVGIGTAYAQERADISIKTPAIQAIQSRMEARFSATLRAGFDSGALGFTGDGLVTVRDPSKIELKDRVTMNAAVADDNRDRKAVYREMAVANGHPEWEAQLRSIFAQQWIASARSGWWYQAGGAWKQK